MPRGSSGFEYSGADSRITKERDDHVSQRSSLNPKSFGGSERFVIEKKLGAGGMGVVYQTFDRERGERVALKTLPRMDAKSIHRLKQEFRALADVTHPNLVCLHELVADGEEWFFTMDLVEGVDFLKHVREGEAPSEHSFSSRPHTRETTIDSASRSMTSPAIAPTLGEAMPALNTVVGGAPFESGDVDASPVSPAHSQPPRPSVGDAARVSFPRLRATLAQLVRGVSALHEAGKLHRDIKPSNVIVGEGGRVVILDFGLVQDGRADQTAADENAFAGTPAFMAPEQAAGLPLTPAADWYGVGAMLYLAITGHHPFEGTSMQMMVNKQMREARAPSSLAAGIPDDIEALCVALLRRDPADRARGRDLALALAASTAGGEGESPPGARSSGALRAAAFVGRERELVALRAALAETRKGKPVIAYVHGASGIGKSALVQHFLGEIAESGDTVVLSGRCYERESLPFKAFDSIIDALTRYLRTLPRDQSFWLLPGGIHELARVFPSLRRVEAIADVPPRTFDVPNLQELRRLAFAALKDLLSRLVEKRPVVLYIDDLQWGDQDSALLLEQILGPPNPPAILVVGTYRSEEATESAFLRARPRTDDDVAAPKRIAVGALSDDEGIDLALRLLDEGESDSTRTRAAAMAREAEGNPFFLAELARDAAAESARDAMKPPSGDQPDAQRSRGDVSLDRVLAARIARLPEEPRRLLEAIAVAGGPVAQGVAARAAGSGSRASLHQLRAAHLVRSRGTRDEDAVETYHDRIREVACRGLDAPSLARCHLRLAESELDGGRANPEFLASHFAAAGETQRAGEYAVIAAARAEDALAFDRAAALYRRALDLRPGADTSARELRVRLGDALLNAGRSAEAAAVFLEAARDADATQALELRRRAAEQLLISGHVDEAQGVLRQVLEAVDLPFATSSRRALVSLLYRRARLALRGLDFHERDESEVSVETLRRIDVCYSVSLGLAVVDTIHAAAFQTQHLLLALEAGEPFRIALGLTFEAGFVSTQGGPERKRALELVALASRLADRLQNPHAQGFARLMSGVADWGVGCWRTGLESLTAAEKTLRERCTGVTWEIDTAQIFSMICMASLGQVAELSKRLPAWQEEADARGDRYAAASLRVIWGAHVLVALAADDAARARRDVEGVMSGWSQSGFHVQHYYALLSRSMIDIYEGDGRGAHARVMAEWPALASSMLLRVQSLKITALSIRANAALAAAASYTPGSPRERDMLRSAEKSGRDLAGEKMPWSDALAAMVRAAVVLRRGDHGEAIALLELAVRGFDQTDMALHASAARRRLGALVGGERGREHSRLGDSFMTSQLIKEPARLTALLAPALDPKPTASLSATERT